MSGIPEQTAFEDFESTIHQIAGAAPSRNDVARLVADFGAHIGVPDLRLDETGQACITLEDGLVVSLLHQGMRPSLMVAAPMPPEATDNEAVLRSLLKANMSWPQTNGGTFALAQDSAIPMLMCLIPLPSLDVQTLDRQMAEFIDLVRYWHGQIETFSDEKDKTDETRAETAVPDRRLA